MARYPSVGFRSDVRALGGGRYVGPDESGEVRSVVIAETVFYRIALAHNLVTADERDTLTAFYDANADAVNLITIKGLVYQFIFTDAGGYRVYDTNGTHYNLLVDILCTRIEDAPTVDEDTLRAVGLASVDTIPDLRAYPTGTLADGDKIYVSGYWSIDDGAYRVTYWDAASTDADDGGVTILPTGHTGPGRWKFPKLDYNFRDFGAKGNGTSDDRVAIQTCLDYCVANSLTAYGTDGIYKCGDTVLLSSNLKLEMSSGCQIRRGFESNTHPEALISQSPAGTLLENIEINGGNLDGGSSSSTGGPLLYIYCDAARVTNVRFTGNQQPSIGGGAQAMIYGGDGFIVSDCIAIASATGITQSGTGAFRYIGGTGLRASNLYADCGDDCFQFVTITDEDASPWDLDIIDGLYINCFGLSHKARVMIASIEGPQSDLMTCSLLNCGFIGVNGTSHTNKAINCRNTRSTGRIDNVYFENCSVSKDNAGGVNESDPAILITADDTLGTGYGEIGTVRFTNVRLYDSPGMRGFDFQNFITGYDGFRVILENCEAEGHTAVVDLNGSGEFRIQGGRFTCKPAPTGGAYGQGIRLGNTADFGKLWLYNSEVIDIANGKFGIQIVSCEQTHVEHFRPRRLSGATTATGVKRTTTGTSLNCKVRDIETSEIDTPVDGYNEPPAHFDNRFGLTTRASGTATIANGTSSIAVSFPVDFPSIQYAIALSQKGTAQDLDTLRTSAKATTGFTINVGTNVSSDAVIDWIVEHYRG